MSWTTFEMTPQDLAAGLGPTLPGPLSPPTSHDQWPGVQLHPACLTYVAGLYVIRIHVLSCRHSKENLLQSKGKDAFVKVYMGVSSTMGTFGPVGLKKLT